MKRTPSAMRGHAFHFLRYGIGFLVAHLLLIVLGLWAWDALLEDRTEAGLLAEMRGTHALLQHRFAETPREQWPTLARELDADFAYALRMVPLAEAMKALPASQRPPLQQRPGADRPGAHAQPAADRRQRLRGDAGAVGRSAA